MKVTVMGTEVHEDDLPEDSPELEFHFAAPVPMPKAIDRASQVVPEEFWRAVGIYTWLAGRAEQAFKTLAVGKNEAELGKLRYVFGRNGDQPTLEHVILINLP